MASGNIREEVVSRLRFYHKTIENSLMGVTTRVYPHLEPKDNSMSIDEISKEMCYYIMSFYELDTDESRKKLIKDWESDMDAGFFIIKHHEQLQYFDINRRELVENIVDWRNRYTSIFKDIMLTLGIDPMQGLGVGDTIGQEMLRFAKHVCNVPTMEAIQKFQEWNEEMDKDWRSQLIPPNEFAAKWWDITDPLK